MYSAEYRWIRKPTPVITSIISTASWSIWIAMSTRRSPRSSQVHARETCVRCPGESPRRPRKIAAVHANAARIEPQPIPALTAFGGSPGHSARTRKPASGRTSAMQPREVANRALQPGELVHVELEALAEDG